MKSVAALVMFLAALTADAEDYPAPVHSANEILDAVLKNTKLTPRQIEVVVLTYDYVKGIWHVELAPSDRSCTDCLPSFFVKNGEAIVVEKLPHG